MHIRTLISNQSIKIYVSTSSMIATMCLLIATVLRVIRCFLTKHHYILHIILSFRFVSNLLCVVSAKNGNNLKAKRARYLQNKSEYESDIRCQITRKLLNLWLLRRYQDAFNVRLNKPDCPDFSVTSRKIIEHSSVI